MPSRDDSIDLDRLPNMKADVKNEPILTESDQPKTTQSLSNRALQSNYSGQSPPPTQTLFAVKALWSAIFVLILLIGGLSYFMFEAKQLAAMDGERINALEAQLSTTDESMSQSSVAMQVKLNDLKSKTDDLWNQMDKLWASAWRRNQTDIAEHGNKIKSNSTKVDDTQKLIKELEKVNVQLKKEMIALQKDAEKLRQLKKQVEDKLAAQKTSLNGVTSNVSQFKQTLTAVDKRSNDNARWIESINAFRKQTNKALSDIEKQLQTPPATALTQP